MKPKYSATLSPRQLTLAVTRLQNHFSKPKPGLFVANPSPVVLRKYAQAG